MLIAIDKVRFYKRIGPQSTLKLQSNIVKVAMGMATAIAMGFVEGVKTSECQITYKIAKEIQ